MLFKDFYSIQSVNIMDKNVVHAQIQLNKNHAVFNGHFPNNPVTPGVCMIQAIKEITQDYVKETLFLQNISNVKFTALINPFINSNLIIELSIIPEGNAFKVKNITRFADGIIALKCNGTFVKK